MPARISSRPAATDYAEYFDRYISLVPTGDLVSVYEKQLQALPALLARVRPEHETHRYAPNKWSVREVVGHLSDTERVFSYRATHISRADAHPLPSFDQDAWTPYGEYDSRTLADLTDEWITVRRCTLSLLRNMPAAGLERRGIASDRPFSVLALLCVIPGHVQYHMEHFQSDYSAAFS